MVASCPYYTMLLYTLFFLTQPTLNIWNTGMYRLDIICYRGWYYKLDSLNNKYEYRDQTLLYKDLYKKISIEFIHESI